jgi:four helix bundle protein
MGTELEELRVVKTAEAIADAIWKQVIQWDRLARDVVGGQLARAADSIGANIAEAYGRFHYGEKLQHLYYARGSLFETKYWLNRAQNRGLMPAPEIQQHLIQLTDPARQLNAFVGNLKNQRSGESTSRALRESRMTHIADGIDSPSLLFNDAELKWIESLVPSL